MNDKDQTEYNLGDDERETLAKWRHFSPHGDQTRRYIRINQETRNLAKIIMYNCPDSTERKEALKRLEDCRLWANSSIMKNEGEGDGEHS